jgi:hypothetical protein
MALFFCYIHSSSTSIHAHRPAGGPSERGVWKGFDRDNILDHSKPDPRKRKEGKRKRKKAEYAIPTSMREKASYSKRKEEVHAQAMHENF